jgi:hypothetical protein
VNRRQIVVTGVFVSVPFEDIASDDWTEVVYKPDIAAKPDSLHKRVIIGQAPQTDRTG